MMEILQTFITLIEMAAATLLILGFVIATTIWIRDSFFKDDPDALKHYRRALTRTILIGLEVLVAATIIKTVTLQPDLESMGRLVFLVVLRTAICWTTSLESNGHWPWQNRG